MAANNFEKTMRNRTLSEQGRGATPRTNSRDSWTFRIEVAPTDKTLLRSFFAQEMQYYNHLVEGFSSRLRTFPETLLALSGPWEELFADLAFTGVNPRRVSKPDQLPEPLKKHEKLLFEDKTKKPISERTLMVLELAGTKFNIDPLARRAMALEMLRFYRQQAGVSTASVPPQLREEQVYRTPPEILETVDLMRKRHVQLPRGAVNARYDEKTNRTTFRIPYARESISVIGDFTLPASWNLMIVRQLGEMPHAPWQVELRKSPTQYLVKLLDTVNPYRNSSFNVAKTARSAI